MNTDIIINGDALAVLKGLPDRSVNGCVTSPPYYALRDYGHDAQIGREDTPEQYIERLSSVFRELYRVLRSDGISIARQVTGCKPKDLIGIPWMLAFALRRDGWYLCSDIVWQKNNPMPESAKDRPTRCYEHIFLLAKSKKYYYDAVSVAEPRSCCHSNGLIPAVRSRRDVWLINTVPYKGGHFAAFPPKLAETCILAGCPEAGTVIDPFFGSGTTGLAAKNLNRHYIGIEINTEYCRLAEQRIGGDIL